MIGLIAATLAAFPAALVAGPPAGGKAQLTHEYVLDNGVQLIVQEDHRAPVAVVQVWYRVGAVDEYDGITGVSHALEHMMFKGTKSRGPGEFSRIVSTNGGQENAFTSYDYTAYFQQWSADNVGLSFELEADRMRNLLLDEEEFKREINVVLEERRLRTDDNPQALAFEAARAVAFQTSPYRQPVIGWEADIRNMTAADLRAWYERYYRPNNAIVVVVGDVEPDAVHALARQYFGPLEPRPVDATKPRPEVPQFGTKRVDFVSDKARVPYLAMGYKVPTFNTAQQDEAVDESDVYALDVLAEVLAGDASSRLRQNLVRGSEIATHAGVSYNSASKFTTLFTLSAVPRDGHELAELEAAVNAELERVKSAPIDAAELERIKTQVVADSVFERDSMQHQAILIGSLEATGVGWELKDSYAERIAEVTPAQVQEVARRYLDAGRLTVAMLHPQAAP